jgi:multiple sugar transport system permease protein
MLRKALHAGAVYALTALFLLPVIWMIATSFKPAGEYVSTSIDLLPNAATLQHYRQLLQDDLLGKLTNSLIVSFGATFLALAAGFPAAYALERLKLPRHWDAVFLIFVLVIKLVPPIVLAIPLYQVLRALGLLDTLAGLILVYQIYALPFAIWMLLGFVRDVPHSYEEAAVIDGASLWQLLTKVVLPLMLPGLVATAVFLLILCWNEFVYALLFIQTPSKFTLPTYIATLITEDETFWGKLAAIGFLASLPILALVGVVQKGLTRSFVGGLK